MNNFKGFELFNDVEDKQLQARNRGVVMANIACDHSKDQRINAKGVELICGYFTLINPDDRANAREEFAKEMVKRSWAITNE
jgi:hypothetical protein